MYLTVCLLFLKFNIIFIRLNCTFMYLMYLVLHCEWSYNYCEMINCGLHPCSNLKIDIDHKVGCFLKSAHILSIIGSFL